jgi:hypothetical protein
MTVSSERLEVSSSKLEKTRWLEEFVDLLTTYSVSTYECRGAAN